MGHTWVVIANSVEAKIYDRESRDELRLVHTLSHPESRSKGRSLASDRPGHYESTGGGHGAFVEEKDPKDFEVERFAKELAEYLDDSRSVNRFDKLIIAAAPRFHGLLNSNLDSHTVDRIEKHIEKDLTRLSGRALASRVNEFVEKLSV